MSSTCSGSTGGRRRHRTKKHRRSRHRSRRGGAALADFRGVESYPGGHVDIRGATGISGSTANQNASSYNQDTAGTYASYGGRRRTRRRRHRRMRGGDAFSPMGGDGKGGVTATWNGENVGGVALSGRVYDAGTNR
jgi:hypothetical protein